MPTALPQRPASPRDRPGVLAGVAILLAFAFLVCSTAIGLMSPYTPAARTQIAGDL